MPDKQNLIPVLKLITNQINVNKIDHDFMAAPKKQAKKEQKTKNIEKPAQNTNKRKYLILIIGIIILIALATPVYFYFFYLSNKTNTPVNFNIFKNNFDLAKNISIAVSYNSTEFSYEMGCADSLIYNIVSSKIKNASDINFFVLTSTNCTYLKNGLGGLITNYTNSSASKCINLTNSNPTIFINYSAANKTIIKSKSIYISGDQNFLKQCGIAEQIK